LHDALLIEGLEKIVDGIDLKGADGVLVERGREDDLREGQLPAQEFFEDGEAIEAGHLDIEKDDVGLVLTDELDGFDAVGSVGENVDAASSFEEELELLAGERFIVDDECGEGHAN